MNILIGGHQIAGLSGCYRDAGPQSLLAVIGSMGFVEISVNCGSASAFCGESKGSIVTITPVGRQ